MKNSKFQQSSSRETSTSRSQLPQSLLCHWRLKFGACLVVGVWFLVLFSDASAQSYSINWYKIAGGGGVSASGPYTISGTIGQPDASAPMTGGNYSLTGGFWAFLSVIQTPGAPTLYITHSGSTVTVFWQNVSGWSLEQNNNLTGPTGWSTNSSWTNNISGTNYLNLTSPTGNLFFRLIQ